MVFEVTILGSSSALPTSQRYPSAHVVNAHERFFLIDCGEGTQMQLRKNRFRIGKINNIFISHTHGDHIFGLYGLLSTMNLIGRKAPVSIYAPSEFGPLLTSHLSDFDIHLNYDLDFIPLSGKNPAKIYEDKNITVTSFPLKHRIPAYGFLFREKIRERNIKKEMIGEYHLTLKEIVNLKRGDDLVTEKGKVIPNSELTLDPPRTRSFAYCSDTSYFKRLAEFVKGVDLLYHESTFGSEFSELAKITGHSTAADAATVASEAKVGQLILGHFSARYKDVAPLLTEARRIFKETRAAEDNLTITL